MSVYDVLIIPLIVGVVELLKMLGLPTKFGALAGLILGIVMGVFYVSPYDVPKGIIEGAALGLASSGLYSGTKNTKEVFIKD